MYRPKELSLEEVGALSLLAVSVATLVLLPVALYRWFVGDPEDWRSNPVVAAGAGFDVCFVAVAGVTLLLGQPVHPATFLLWEAGLVLSVVGVVRAWVKQRRSPEVGEWDWRDVGRRDRGPDAGPSRSATDGGTDGETTADDGVWSDPWGAGGEDDAWGSAWAESDDTDAWGGAWRSATDAEAGETTDTDDGWGAGGTADAAEVGDTTDTDDGWGTAESTDTEGSPDGGADDETAAADATDGWSREDLTDVDPQTGLSRAAEVLQIEADADGETIEAAYRERVKETHPDAGGSTEAFITVKEAYRILSNRTAA